ncbi:toprim domain-containing protein, partial [Klebsiella pneumoniae]
IRQQAAGCSLVVVATDDDREGDKIGWDIVEHCLDWAGPVRRMRPRAATPDGIRAAHAEMLRLPDGGALRSYCGALEARARQHADWHIGINGTRQ